MSDNTSGGRLTKRTRILGKGKGKGKERREVVVRHDDELFVLIDGKLLPVDTSGHHLEHGRGGLTRIGKTFKSPKNASPVRVHSLEARMYIGSNDAVEVLEVIAAYTALMRELGFGRIDVVSAEAGSVWTKISQTYKKIAETRKVRVAATQLVGLLEGATTEKFQADNTATHANAAANLAEKTKHMASFSFDSGPLQFVQWQDEDGKTHGAARVVSSKDIAAKRLDEEIVKNPQKMIEYLREQPDAITAPEPSDE
ncbi:hypothetical protein ACFUPZ_00015 [Microbacterium oxydans]|uniref:hypothetical protein n=1 Tax=Microbacterium oxydans TaxID=82380 RepID=UPI003644611F